MMFLHTEAPGPEYRILGWHCIYHEQAGRMCHNPLDCDMIPLWGLTVDEAKKTTGWSREKPQR